MILLIVFNILGITYINVYADNERINKSIDKVFSWYTSNDQSDEFTDGDSANDWFHLAMSRYKKSRQTDKYFSGLNSFLQNISQKDNMNATDYERYAIVAGSYGKSAEKYKVNLIKYGICDNENIEEQGINGLIYGLIAVDSHKYRDSGKYNRKKIINMIIEQQLKDGGFALDGEKADTDITAMALQALSPYYNDSKYNINDKIDASIKCLSKMQNDDGGYESYGISNSESISQVVIALCSLDIDPFADKRFIKQGNNTVDALLRYQKDNGAFTHIKDGEDNAIAGSQASMALVALDRRINKRTSLYDMTDIDIEEKNNYIMYYVIGSIAILLTGIAGGVIYEKKKNKK